MKLSVLDLAPIVEGGDAALALRCSLELARHVEKLGFHRFWLAEHHGMPGIASAATAVAIAHVAQGTSKIRVGAGGVMIPNHAPLVIAEQFGTLESLFPGRIDLGVGRAPGTDQRTANALRRNLNPRPVSLASEVQELLQYFGPYDGRGILAVPGENLRVPIYILGSSLYGAQVAASLGLPYAFASHFAPADLDAALAIYREEFQPSQYLDKPYVMAGFTVIAAETDEEARYLASSVQQAIVKLRTGTPGKLPKPVKDLEQDPMAQMIVSAVLACSAVGSPQTVKQKLLAFQARTQADEIIVPTQIYDFEKRLRSYEILARVWHDIGTA